MFEIIGEIVIFIAIMIWAVCIGRSSVRDEIRKRAVEKGKAGYCKTSGELHYSDTEVKYIIEDK